jgi:hypothetical protein
MLLPITTGLSIALMNSLDEYRANGVKLIAGYQFSEDVELALRQELSTTVDDVVAAISKNPRSAATVAAVVDLPIPQTTPQNQEVFGFEVPAEVPSPSPAFNA